MNFLEKQLEDPIRFIRIKRWYYVGLAGVFLAEIFLPLIFQLIKLSFELASLPVVAEMFHTHQPHFWFESFPSGKFSPKLPWGSVYGVVSCIAIIVVSKFLGKVWLMRREDYYDS